LLHPCCDRLEPRQQRLTARAARVHQRQRVGHVDHPRSGLSCHHVALLSSATHPVNGYVRGWVQGYARGARWRVGWCGGLWSGHELQIDVVEQLVRVEPAIRPFEVAAHGDLGPLLDIGTDLLWGGWRIRPDQASRSLALWENHFYALHRAGT